MHRTGDYKGAPGKNPAVQNQATDRAHRIGQKNPVTVYKLIARNTIEEHILKLQQKKSPQEIIKAHRGKIQVEDTLGGGASFVVILL